jgi:lycopene beta-cyclase
MYKKYYSIFINIIELFLSYFNCISKNMKQHFDCIIAGGGCAGLSLAYHLVSQGYSGDVLILDRERKSDNDRTWCWWSKVPTPFDSLLTHQWRSLTFADSLGSLNASIAPYRYCLLRAGDFYSFMYSQLEKHSKVSFLQVDVESIEDGETGAIVCADGTHFSAEWVFSSIPNLHNKGAASKPGLLQHFMGWWIDVDEDRFDPSSAVLMDFRVEQKNTTRFMYMLPVTKRRALVEFTIFSDTVLSRHAYELALQQYLRDVLKIDHYQINEVEVGVIPMQLETAQRRNATSHVIAIGTAGGAVKPSTGYAFARIQEQTAQIARQLVFNRQPVAQLPRSNRFALYDQLLLQILTKRGDLAAGIFSRLFRRVPFPLVLKFLNEQTWLGEEISILASLPAPPFIRALLAQTWNVTDPLITQPKIVKP